MRAWLLIFGVVLAIRIPFLWQPIQGDDVLYLTAAQHALIDPLHPHNFKIVSQGVEIDMRGFPHPPGNSWILAGLLALVGDVSEPVFHGAYTLFSLLAAGAAFSIARRFSKQPLFATLVFLATPAFVINGNSLESDLPFLAFWLSGMALWIDAVECRSKIRLIGSGLLLACVGLTSFQAVVLIPILWFYLWARNLKWLPAASVTLVPLLAVGGWQLFERLTTGGLPAAVLNQHFADYALQTLNNKAKSAVALTVHLGWMVFPLLTLLLRSRWDMILTAATAAAAAYFDASPLFWLPLACGVLILLRTPGDLFPRVWFLMFFAAALVIFFAGSARYLLPVALPLALLTVERIGERRWLLAAGIILQFGVSLTLAGANHAQWAFYKHVVEDLHAKLTANRRFVNAEMGLRFYAETGGALPLKRTQTLRDGDLIITSALTGHSPAPSGPSFLSVAERTLSFPIRLFALGSPSAYSTAANGFRAFDVASSPVDIVSVHTYRPLPPTLSFLSMNAREAERHILSGVYSLEGNGAWRWTSPKALFALKKPVQATPLQAVFRVAGQAGPRRVSILLDGAVVTEKHCDRDGLYTLESAPVLPLGGHAVVEMNVDPALRVTGDQRVLGVILVSIGFRSPV